MEATYIDGGRRGGTGVWGDGAFENRVFGCGDWVWVWGKNNRLCWISTGGVGGENRGQRGGMTRVGFVVITDKEDKAMPTLDFGSFLGSFYPIYN